MARTVRVNGVARRKPPVSHAKVGPDPDDDNDDNGDDAEVSPDDAPLVKPPVDSLSEMMTSLQGATTSRITVYRVVKNQPLSYVFETDPASFSLDDLRDKYNGGEFRLFVAKDGRLWRNMRVVVEPKQVIHNGQDPAPPTSNMTDVLAIMRDGFAQQAAALRELVAGRPTSSPFANLDLPAIITAAAAAITALRPPPAPVPPPAADNSERALDMFMRGLEIARSLNENSGPADNSLGGMFREALRSPIVQAAVQSALQPAQPTKPALPAPGGTVIPAQPVRPPEQPQVSHAKPPEIAVEPEQDMLTYYLGFLVKKAQGGADPSLYADIVLDNVPDQQLIAMVNRGDALIDDFIKAHPPVAEHRDWFLSLIKSVNDAVSDEAAEQGVLPHAADAASIVVPGDAAA